MGKAETRDDRRRLENLAAHVRREMQAAGLSLRQVARGAKVPSSTLSRLLRLEGVPTLGDVLRLAEFFGKPVEEMTSSPQAANGRPKSNGQTLTADREDGYNPGSMSPAKVRPKRPTIGQKIANRRRELNLSQEQLAEGTGLTRVTINRFENGHREPSIRHASRIAAFLHMRTADLLSD